MATGLARRERAGHLWLLLDGMVPAEDLICFDKEVRSHAQVPDRTVEFFPKQRQPGKLGNAVRGPLGIHLEPEANRARGWFEAEARQDVGTQLAWPAAQPLNPGARIGQIAGEI